MGLVLQAGLFPSVTTEPGCWPRSRLHYVGLSKAAPWSIDQSIRLGVEALRSPVYLLQLGPQKGCDCPQA